MTLVRCSFDEIKKMKKDYNNECYDIIEQFINSDMACARVENYEYSNSNSCYNSILRAIKNGHYDNVQVFQMNGQVYLVKKNIKEIFE